MRSQGERIGSVRYPQCGLRQEGWEEFVLWRDGRMSEIAIRGALLAM